MRDRGGCTVEGCTKRAFARTWCRKHYMRWWTHGNVDKVLLVQPPHRSALSWIDQHKQYQGDDCLIWPFNRNNMGYAIITNPGGPRVVSRIMCIERNGPPPSAVHQAAHSCGRGHEGCVNPRHVSWKTPKENTADRYEHNTILRGEDVAQAKLTERDVREIRSYTGLTQSEIGHLYGVSQSLVGMIKRRKRWGWLT